MTVTDEIDIYRVMKRAGRKRADMARILTKGDAMRKIANMLAPNLTGETLRRAAMGETVVFAVYVERHREDMTWAVLKVEPWDAMKHINANPFMGVVRVGALDELEAYTRTKKALEEYDVGN